MTFRLIYRALVPLVALAACLALTTTAQAAAPAGKAAGTKAINAGGARARPGAAAGRVFRPRIRNALGIFPQFTFRNGRLQPAQSASQPLTPLTYHGGQTMTGGVTVHTIFWSGGTNPFQGQPPGAPHDYIGMIQQYLTDVAAASTGTSGQACTVAHCNVRGATDREHLTAQRRERVRRIHRPRPRGIPRAEQHDHREQRQDRAPHHTLR
jgi:hypothetical protein